MPEAVNSDSRRLIEDLCNIEVPDDLQVSSDALRVLYRTHLRYGQRKGKHALSTLWLADMGVEHSARQISSGTFNDHHPRWHPHGKYIAFISDRSKLGKLWAVYLWNMRNGTPLGEPWAITDTENERQIAAFEFSPDGKQIAYLRADPETAEHKARKENGEDWQVWGDEWVHSRLHTIDIETKRVSRYAGEDMHHVLFNDHVTSLSWHADSLMLAVTHVKTSEIEEPYLTGSKISIVKLLPEQKWSVHLIADTAIINPGICWGPRERLYFVAGVTIGKVCGGSAVYSVESKQDATPARVAFGTEDDAKGFISVKGSIIGYAERGMEDVLVDLPSKLIFCQAQRIQGFHAGIVDGSDQLSLVLATSNINTPTQVYSTTSQGSGLIRLSNHGALFRDRLFGSYNPFSCRSLDNEVDLDGVFLTPSQNLPAEPQPTVVLIHGGPSDRSTNEFDTYLFYWTPFLLHHGYSVVLTNYRGSTGKGQDFASWTWRGVGKYDYEDVVTITNHAVGLKYANPERLLVAGISQGGFLTYLCSTRNGSLFPWKFSAAVPLNGITDADTMALTSDLGGSVEAELDDGRLPWTSNKSDCRSRQASAIWEIEEAVHKSEKEGAPVIPPMLILHSENDQRCPIEQARGMRRALLHHGLPFEYVVYPRQGHLLQEQKFWVDIAERLLRWCETYIGPAEQSASQAG